MSAALGTRLGPRLIALISQCIVSTHQKLLHTKHKLAMAVFNSISDEISDEVDLTLGPVLKMLHEATPTDHAAYPALHFMYTASGQLKALVGQGLQTSGLLGAVSEILNNALAPVVYDIIAKDPNSLPDVGTVAQMAAQGIISDAEATNTINRSGYSNEWAQNLITAAHAWPGIADATRLFLRGVINRDAFITYAGLNGVSAEIATDYLAIAYQPVSPPDAALALLRGNMSQADAVAAANAWGVNEADFNIMVGNTGEPPGTEQLLEAYRRGFIDEARLVHGILQSRTRNEWVDVIEKLRYEPITTADAVDAAVQGHITQAEMTSLAQVNGLENGQVDILYQTAGSPLSRTEAEDLFNRGLMSEADVKQALRESRLKDKYVDQAFDLHSKVLPIYNLQRLVQYGAIDHQSAVKIAMENGYSTADAANIVNGGSQQRLTTYKTQVVSSVVTLLEDSAIGETDAVNMIVSFGFEASEAAFIVQAGMFRKEAKDINTAISAVKSKYLARHITEQEASGILDAIGIAATQRDYLLGLWTVTWSAYTKTLTEAQTVKAVADGLITPQDGLDRLVYMGYSQVDATLLLEGA